MILSKKNGIDSVEVDVMLDFFFKAIVATKSGALAIAKSNGLLSARDVAGEGWNNVASRASLLQRETSGRLSSFNKKLLLDNGVDLVDMKSKLSVTAGSLSKVLETFSSRFFPPGKGMGAFLSYCNDFSVSIFLFLYFCCLLYCLTFFYFQLVLFLVASKLSFSSFWYLIGYM
jgi:hypothetical protein